MIAVVYGVCAVACYLLCYALCRERVQAAPPREAKRQSFASLAKALAGNRALTAVIGAALLLPGWRLTAALPLIAALCGGIAGLLPAVRAASMDPIEAMRK